jgi:hypothetical protein
MGVINIINDIEGVGLPLHDFGGLDTSDNSKDSH